jgi:polyhydroxybutyrate depolymerase
VRLRSVDSAARRWARILDCRARGHARPAAGLALSRWSRCAGGASVRLYTVRGAGHVWPRPPAFPDASALILDVFDRS